MQYDRYPFIDLAVHKDIRERFARGEALAVTSPDLGTVVWANGPAADLFGYSSIYELIDDGIDTRPAIKRQIAGAIVGLARKDGQSFLIRVAHGFRREAVPAHVQLIELPGGPPAVLISAERDYPGGLSARARQIISGFDDGDAHVAVIDDAGTVLAGSASFDGAELSESDLQRMARDVAQQPDRLVKRMIDSAGGKKPAAIGRLTDDPALNLVFVVETGADEDEPDHDQQPEATKATEPPPLPIFGADAVREELDASRPPEVQDDIPVAFASSREITSESDEAPAHDQEAHETNGGRRFEDDPLWDEVPPQPPLDGGADTTMDANDDEVGASDPEATFAEEQADEQATAKDDFIFDPDGRPVRFVWKIDRTGTFSELSPEFALAIGPNAADIIGRNFPDVARVFNLDPDHVITDLLSRRDTWSGKTVYWPIQGTDLMVPVDLAALPTYTRERRFDGFRGFGIVRIGEAQPDPESIGLALVPGPWTPIARRHPAVEDERSNEHNDTIGTADPAAEEMDVAEIDGAQAEELETSAAEPEFVPANDDSATSEEQSETDGHDRDEDAVTAEAPYEPGVTESTAHEAEDEPAKDPFQGETPALAFSPNQGRRENDKVIDLEARRSRSRDTLSPLEQAAFREIGEKLGIGLAAASTTPEPDDVPSSEGAASESSAEAEEPTAEQVPEAPEEVSALFDNVDGPVSDPAGSDDEDVREEDLPVAAAPSEPDDSAEPSGQTDSNTEVTSEDDGSVADDDAVQHDDGTVTDPDEDESDDVDPVDETHDDGSDEASDFVAPPSFYEFQLPSRHQTSYGLTEDLVDMIPAALLVHAGDRLIHGNPEFLKFTGFTSLEDLAEAGGLDILLSSDEETGAMRMRTQSGTERAVVARLRSINWYNSQALLLSLSQKPEAAPEPAVADLSEAPPAAENIAAFPAAVPLDGAEQSSYLERINSLEIEARELRSILETATDGVVIIGEDNRIRSMNGSAHALFGYDDTETLEQPFAMLFAHESQRAVMDYLGGLAEHGVSSVLNDGREVIGREANGGLSPLFMTIGRLSGSNGFCAVLRDITQWKRSEEELRDAKRAAETANSHKSDFLARVSHEIRTPLNAIIGFSEMMVEERFGPIGSPRYLEYANDIGNSGKHVLDIVNDLLDISKIEAGEVDLDFGAVTLNDQLAECVSMLQPLANSQRVIIRTSLSATLPEVVADPRSIKQIALNLLSNAIRYTPSGGQIVVSTGYETNGNVVLRIRDTGIGMTRKELEQAMKPFGQVGPTPRKRGDGTGLGLPLTKAMVEANRAQFDIISAPKEGTLVTITFPSQRVLAD